MTEKNNDYKSLIKQHAPRSPLLKDCLFAFLFGGLICFLGELLASLLMYLSLDESTSYTTVTVFFILLASLLTVFGVFDKIARYAGAGTLLPVTGFSNAVTSAALDSKSEGLILGVGSKIFTVAGPVILYSTTAGTLYGLIYYLVRLFSL